MAQIRKRAPLQYQAQVRLQGHPEASRTFTSKADAVAWATSVEQITKQGLVSLMRCLSDWGQANEIIYIIFCRLLLRETSYGVRTTFRQSSSLLSKIS